MYPMNNESIPSTNCCCPLVQSLDDAIEFLGQFELIAIRNIGEGTRAEDLI
jgi:hypothetical protein